MNKVIGYAFEELDDQEMINVSGGGVPTPVTVTSTFWCIGASIAVSILTTILAN